MKQWFKPQAGLTAVELIVVIVVFGSLVAMAQPRLLHWQAQARTSQLMAARGAIAAAAAIAHGPAYAARGKAQEPCSVGSGFGPNPPLIDEQGNGNLCTEHGNVQMAHLYPAATLPGIVAAADLLPHSESPLAEDLSIVSEPDGRRLTVQLSSAENPLECAFTYAEPERPGERAQLSAARTSGC